MIKLVLDPPRKTSSGFSEAPARYPGLGKDAETCCPAAYNALLPSCSPLDTSSRFSGTNVSAALSEL